MRTLRETETEWRRHRLNEFNRCGMTVAELSQIELENPPPFKSAACYLTSCFIRYLKYAYHHAKQPQCTVTRIGRSTWSSVSNLWPHFHVQRCKRWYPWIFVKQPLGNIQPVLWWHNTVFSKETLRSVSLLKRPCYWCPEPKLVPRTKIGSGHQKQGLFKRPQTISSCVSGDQNRNFKRKHFSFLTWNKRLFVRKLKAEHKRSIAMREK